MLLLGACFCRISAVRREAMSHRKGPGTPKAAKTSAVRSVSGSSVFGGAEQGQHLCIINWTSRGGPADVSFPVKSCLLNCKVTSFDFHFEKMFAMGIDYEQKSKFCLCKAASNGQELVQYSGTCSAEQCFKHYLVVRTDRYVYHDAMDLTEGHLWKKDSKAGFSITHRSDWYKESTFEYQCTEKACSKGNCALQATFPSLTEGLSTEEKRALVMLINKDRAGQKLNKIEREAVDRIPLHEQDKVLFETLGDSPVLVRTLREKYKGENLDLDPVLVASDLLADDQVVELPDFVRFCRQLEAARAKTLSDDSSAAFLFAALNGEKSGSLTVAAVRPWYDRALASTGIDAGSLLVHDDLVDDGQDVDMDRYKRFRKLLRKARDQKWALSNDAADEVVFEDLSGGHPVKLKPLLDQFQHRASEAGVDIQELKREPDLGLRDDNDLDTFKRFANLVRKGEKSKLTEDAVGEELFKEVGHTVPALRDAYKARLQGRPIDLEHCLREADLVGEKQSVDLPEFKLFRKLLKKAGDNQGTLDEDGAAEVAFHAKSPHGDAIDARTAAESFKHRLDDAGIDEDKLLSAADLDFGQQDVDLPGFKRLAALTRKAAAGELSDDSTSKLLLDGVCPPGQPCKVAQVRGAYASRLADVGQALTQAFLPSDEQEVDLPAFKRFRKVARKAKEADGGIQDDEAAELLFQGLTDGAQKPLTAGRLREDFSAHLKHGDVDVQHLFDAAELTSDNQEVTLPRFKRFAKMLHKAQAGNLTDDAIAEVLLSDLGHHGPVKVAKLKAEYAKSLEDAGADVGLLLAEADLAAEDQAVDLGSFKRFRKLALKAKEKGHDLTEDEVAETLLDDLASKVHDSKVLVKHLRNDYQDRLKEAGLDVGHVLSDAGLQDESATVELPAFQKFLKAVKRAKEGAPTDTELFRQLSPDGSPVTVAKLREVYDAKLTPHGVSVDDLIRVAGLEGAEGDAVDLVAFQRFLHPKCPQ